MSERTMRRCDWKLKAELDAQLQARATERAEQDAAIARLRTERDNAIRRDPALRVAHEALMELTAERDALALRVRRGEALEQFVKQLADAPGVYMLRLKPDKDDFGRGWNRAVTMLQERARQALADTAPEAEK